MERRDKHNYYLDIAETVLKRGTCMHRNDGSIIVKNDEIIASGYSGAPRRRKNCIDLGSCVQDKSDAHNATRIYVCRSIHSEVNAIISSSRKDMIGATLYLVEKDTITDQVIENTYPCALCKGIIINAGIERVIIRDTQDKYRFIRVQDWIDHDDTLSGQ